MARLASGWGGRVILGDGALLYVGPGGIAERHAHHAVQVMCALDGDFTVTFDVSHRRRAVLIPAGVGHAVDAVGRRVAVMLVEPHGARGAALDRRARAQLGADIAPQLQAIGFPPLELGVAEAAGWRDAAFAALDAEAGVAPMSSVSRRAIAYVESTVDGKPELAEAARRIGISPTRLTHVFTREVGIPFRRFVLWARIKRIVEASQAGSDLTQAAVAAGFSDSAHLSRTFRGMFGLSPSLIVPLVEFVGSVSPEG